MYSLSLYLRGLFELGYLHLALLLSLGVGGFGLVIMTGQRNADPYGLFHLSLNKIPEDSPDNPPETEWLNMGYWKVRLLDFEGSHLE
jgi:hypothetical protein